VTSLALTVIALVTALVAAGWAGMLALAEEAPGFTPGLGPAGADPAESVPAHRALGVGRLALIVLSGVAASEAVGWWFRPPLEGLTIVLVTATFLFMVADALPRAVGLLAPEAATAALSVARRTLLPFRPLLGLVGGAERLIQRLVPPPTETEGSALNPSQRDMLLGVFALGDTTVADVMTPRIDLAGVPADATWEELLDRFRRREHARIPVYQETLDNIVGILHARELVPAVGGVQEPPARWQDLIRPADFVPESKTLAAQLQDFQRGPSHLAIVVDEFGGTSGLITLEDVLEEIVGEIRDEYDVDEQPAVDRDGADRFWVDGRLSLDQLSALLGAPLERDGVSTVGGLIYSELGRVPSPGDEFRLGDFRVVVEQMTRRRIRRVYFERAAAPEFGGGEEGA
jgi:CBS domain containing-hemolysin-like protein